MNKKYVAVHNFKDGKIQDWKHFKIGQEYDGENAEYFLKEGFIKEAGEYAEEQAQKLEKEIVPLKSKADEIRARAAAFRSAHGVEPKKEFSHKGKPSKENTKELES